MNRSRILVALAALLPLTARGHVGSPNVFFEGQAGPYPVHVIIRPAEGEPLVVPEGAVVVPGARAVTTGEGRDWGLSLATPARCHASWGRLRKKEMVASRVPRNSST